MHECMDCRFCGISKGQYKYLSVDEPVFSNQDFFAIASIGALVEGWTLVIPNNHHFSMRTLYRDRLLSNAINSVLFKIREKYGQNIIAFEHGANCNDSTTACGTSHAHLHLVPYPHSLNDEIEASKLEWISCKPSEIDHIAGDREYLFYLDLNDGAIWEDQLGCIHVLRKPISQFFRRIIAKRCGKAQYADYKTHPMLDVAAKTRAMFTS